MHNASTIEIVWFCLSLLGFGVSLFALIDATLDLRALGDTQNGRRVVARSNVRSEAVRTIVLAMFAGIGAIAMALPAGGDRSPLLSTLAALIPLALVGGVFLLVAESILARRDRHRLLRMADRARSKD